MYSRSHHQNVVHDNAGFWLGAASSHCLDPLNAKLLACRCGIGKGRSLRGRLGPQQPVHTGLRQAEPSHKRLNLHARPAPDLQLLHLPLTELRVAPNVHAALLGFGDALGLSLPPQLYLKLGDGSQQAEHQMPDLEWVRAVRPCAGGFHLSGRYKALGGMERGVRGAERRRRRGCRLEGWEKLRRW